jgi:FkbM family methyltransferase
MKLHHKIAKVLGYDLVRRKTSHLNFEDHLFQVFQKYKIDVVIDVGANIGQFAEKIRDKGYRGYILSFEPAVEAYLTLKEKAGNDPRWKIFNFALGEEEGKLKINITKSTDFSSFYTPNNFCKEIFPEASEIINTYEVDVKRLDQVMTDIVKDIPGKSFFLKTDTQGFDINVFKGAKNFIKSVKGLTSEVSMKSIYDHAPHFIESLELYQKEGFLLTGLFPVFRDKNTFIVFEFDAVMVRLSN